MPVLKITSGNLLTTDAKPCEDVSSGHRGRYLLPEGTVPRSNRSARTPQVRKSRRAALAHIVEDRVARAHVRREVEDSYRREPERTYLGGRLVTVTFTDPSWLA